MKPLGVTMGSGQLIVKNVDNINVRLPEDSFIISDPPYGINYRSGSNSSSSISSTGKRFTRKVLGDDKPFDPLPWCTYQQVVFTGAQYYYSLLPRGGMIHCWDKRGNYKPLDQADADLVWIKNPSKPFNRSRVFHLAWRGICRHSENRDKILHPTQKPVVLMEWMIKMSGARPNDIIVDPYMGSGTTGIACVNLGMRFIGIEVDTDLFLIACDRLKTHYARSYNAK